MNNRQRIDSTLDSLQQGKELIFVIDPEAVSANDVNELKEAFQLAYREKFGGNLKIDSIKRDRETQLVISVFSQKEGEK